MPRRRTDRPRARPPERPPGPAPDLDPAAIDALYGLEPVIEPGAGGDGPAGFVVVECPWCWERYETPVDLSAGGAVAVEDCQVCCRPIELAVEVDAAGRLAAVRAARAD